MLEFSPQQMDVMERAFAAGFQPVAIPPYDSALCVRRGECAAVLTTVSGGGLRLLAPPTLLVDGNLIPSRSIAVRKQWNRVGLDSVRQSRIRDVSISEPLLSLLCKLKQKQSDASPNSFVLISRTGTAFWPATVLQNRLKPLAREIGLPWIAWHTFSKARKTNLSELKMDQLYRRTD